MRISDWSSDVCSSDLPAGRDVAARARRVVADIEQMREAARRSQDPEAGTVRLGIFPTLGPYLLPHVVPGIRARFPQLELLLVEEKSDVLLARLHEGRLKSEEHTSELQSLMRISYAVFCLKINKTL